MTRTIIGVRGQPNSGKTKAIRLAHEALADEGQNLSFNTRYDASELKEVLEIDGVLVGFASAGDNAERLQRTLEFLREHNCRVIVCAARLNRSAQPFHGTIEVVERFGRQSGFKVDWIDKLREQSEYESANRDVAEEIVAKVHLAIAGSQPAHA